MSECRCGRPTRDEAYVCETCLDTLARALGEVPWLAEELDVTISRQKGVDYRGVGGGKGGKKASERPSPVVWGASEARTHLKALLTSWALFCEAETVRNSSPYAGLPDDNLEALSRWLMWRVDGLSLLEIGLEAVDEITSAVAHCHRLIDRPADRQFLGECEQQDCRGDLYGKPGGSTARCDACYSTINADELRRHLLAKLDDKLYTAAEIARLSTYLGLKADRVTVRKRINQWHARGLLAASPAFADEPAFRFGTVYERLIAQEYGTSTKEAS